MQSASRPAAVVSGLREPVPQVQSASRLREPVPQVRSVSGLREPEPQVQSVPGLREREPQVQSASRPAAVSEPPEPGLASSIQA